MQSIAISQRAVEAAEIVLDTVTEAMSDGRICEVESRDIREKAVIAYRATAISDLARATGVALMRGGYCTRVQKLLRDWPVEDADDVPVIRVAKPIRIRRVRVRRPAAA